MKRKFWSSLGFWMMAMALLMSVILSAVALYVCYDRYTAQLMDYYEGLGIDLAQTLAKELSEEDLDRYSEAGKLDSRFAELNSLVDLLRAGSGVNHIYVVHPIEGAQEGYRVVLDSAVIPGTDYYKDSYSDFGATLKLEGLPLTREEVLRGKEFPAFHAEDKAAGLLLTAGAPIFRGDGTFSGYYAMTDIVLENVMRNVNTFVLSAVRISALAAVVLIAVYLFLIHRSFIVPVTQLTNAARIYAEEGNKQAFSRLSFKGGCELNDLASTFRLMLAEIEANNKRQLDLAIREQKLESDTQLANNLNAATRPKALPKRETPYPFQLSGCVHCGEGLACCFYDYFLLDQERLCVLIGEVPGQGLSPALYAVIAQTTLKSHLHFPGLSLDQAMSAANQQLYEMGGGGLYLNVLAGVLDGATGHFTCVNAGEQTPLLLRFREERYDWADVFSYAPLGQSENVTYNTVEMDLSQGDRLFFYTAGLSGIRGAEGQTFGEDRLRCCLNEVRVRQAGLDQQLQWVGDAGKAFAEDSDEVMAFAVLALEYCRRDQAQAHCVLTGDAEGAAALLNFFRGQLQANQISQRQAAQLLVMGDELFALCRAKSREDSRFMAECTVSQEENLVVLRIRGDMGGRDPLEVPENGILRSGADFVRRTCDRVFFESNSEADAVTAIKRLGEGSGAEKTEKTEKSEKNETPEKSETT